MQKRKNINRSRLLFSFLVLAFGIFAIVQFFVTGFDRFYLIPAIVLTLVGVLFLKNALTGR